MKGSNQIATIRHRVVRILDQHNYIFLINHVRVILMITEILKDGIINAGKLINTTCHWLRNLPDTNIHIFCYKKLRTRQSYCKMFHMSSNTKHFDIWKQFLSLPEVSNAFILAKSKTTAYYLFPHSNKKPFWQSKNVYGRWKIILGWKKRKIPVHISKCFVR